jgi:flavin-dependent dehydrogenase
MRRRCDVLVIGAGPAGVAVAIRLQRRGVRVILATALARISSLRETIPPATVEELRDIGVDSCLLECVALRCYGIEARWGTDRSIFHSHLLDPPASYALHIDRSALQVILTAAALREGVTLVEGVAFKSVARHGGGWRVRLDENGLDVESRFLVDATGRSARVAMALGAVRRRFDSLCCVSAVVSRERARFSASLQVEAVSYGWWYAAPTADDQTFVGLISDADIVRTMRACAPHSWSSLFAATGLAHGIPTNPKLRVHPCYTSRLDARTGPAWVAVGDAAATFDPLSSLGLLRALLSAKEASAAIVAGLIEGNSGDPMSNYWGATGDMFGAYIHDLRRHYALETRWQSSRFWARRIHGAKRSFIEPHNVPEQELSFLPPMS